MRFHRLRPTATILALATLGVLAPLVLAAPAGATVPGQIVITEWMYNPTLSAAEFVEVTNIGGSPVDMATYSFDDDSRTPGSFSLASLGTLAAGESGLIVEGTAAAFRTEWGLAGTVKVAGGNTNNLGRSDEVNIFAGSTLADRLTYGDQTFAGTIRTAGKSGVPATCLPLGANNVGAWVLSAVGDGRGSKASAAGDIGSPGTTPLGACGPVTIVGGNGSGSTSTLPCQPEAATGTGPATAGAQPWPGGSTVAVADQACAFKTTTGPEGRDISGLVFDPSNPDVLWAVKNKSWVFRLVEQGGTWAPDPADGWGAGKRISFPGGVGQPDSEGLTIGGDGALYITTERDNAANTFALNSVLRYDPTSADTTLVPTQQWDLTADFPELVVPGGNKDKANLGFEGISFVPDAFLVHHGFVDQSTGAAYRPADYPGHGTGLFFAALENDGKLYAYALMADGSHHRVAVVDTGMGHVMDVQFDVHLQRIWALCDNTCSVTSTVLGVDGAGALVPDAVYARPAGLPNVNIEGFAIAPESTCASGTKEVVWSDDGLSGTGYEGHALYRGTFPCGLGDTTAPTATAQVTGSTPTFGLFGGPVTVSIDADDPGSGVRTIRTWVTGTGASAENATDGDHADVAVSATGTSVVHYVAIDEAGNASAEQTYDVTIDQRPVVSISPEASALEPDTGGQRGIYFQVTLSKPAATPTVVRYFTRDGSATGCTNLACDYGRSGSPANPQALTIPAGATTATLGLSVNSDGVVDPDETFDVVLASVSPGAVLGQDVGTGRIVDVDGLSEGGKPVLMLTPKNAVIEGDGSGAKAQVLINLSKPLTAPLTVTFSSADLDAIGASACGAGADYRIITPRSLTLEAGTLSRTIDVAICANTTATGNRSFQITHQPVTAPPGNELVDVLAPALVEIIDDDAA